MTLPYLIDLRAPHDSRQMMTDRRPFRPSPQACEQGGVRLMISTFGYTSTMNTAPHMSLTTHAQAGAVCAVAAFKSQKQQLI
ncbi:MAG: hypothetical protein C0487_15490 [Leptothrix sp. (in: Bacteria)]|nr:hypothetical protein [Leptothrix sp. (in: b-proteobacteria)]